MNTKRVLLVEDNDAARTALSHLLSDEGYEVIARGSAEEAQAVTDHSQPDIAILDVRLPGRFGDEFGRELSQKYVHVRVIFLTAESVTDHLGEYVPGATVLRKPVDVDALLRLLVAA